jgi:hypothetical protein
MELIAAILLAGPLGYLVRDSRRALIAYLAVWAAIFPFQTYVVMYADSDPGASTFDNALYWVFNAMILAAGIGLNRYAARLAARRRYTRSSTIAMP